MVQTFSLKLANIKKLQEKLMFYPNISQLSALKEKSCPSKQKIVSCKLKLLRYSVFVHMKKKNYIVYGQVRWN